MFSKPPTDLDRAVGDIVERARAGDQVAMAIIAEVRKNAQAGVPRARMTFGMLEKYIKKNPPSRFGFLKAAEPAEGVYDVIHLRRLWSLEAVDVETAIAALPIEIGQVTFWQAVVALVHAPADIIARALPSLEPFQPIVEMSLSIRQLADSSIPIAVFCPIVAWELGE
jgi:hypothetical protein